MNERKNKLIILNKLKYLNNSRNNIFFKCKNKLKDNLKLFFQLKFLKIIIELSLLLILFNKSKIQEANDISSRDDIRFITSYFGVKEIKRNHRIRKYFQSLDNFVPYAHIIFCVSEHTKIDPIIIKHRNITINIERFETRALEDLLNKYPYSSSFFYNGIRYYFYSQYLKKHSEIKYVIISDDDTLFFRDPFPLIYKAPNVVHFMEDVLPFSVKKNLNYIWTNAWACLDKTIKKKCGFKQMNKDLLSHKFKNKIPLNSGLLMGSSKNIIKIADLIYTRFICPGMFPKNAEQGLLNYLDLSGEIKELSIPIKRHNIYNDSLLSCPESLPIKNYIQQLNSLHFIALHHHQYLDKYYISQTPKKFQSFLKKKF
jgi:hypothetical protein